MLLHLLLLLLHSLQFLQHLFRRAVAGRDQGWGGIDCVGGHTLAARLSRLKLLVFGFLIGRRILVLGRLDGL